MLYLLVIGVTPLRVEQPSHQGASCCFHLCSWSMMKLFSTEIILILTKSINNTLVVMTGCVVWQPNLYVISFNWQARFKYWSYADQWKIVF